MPMLVSAQLEWRVLLARDPGTPYKRRSMAASTFTIPPWFVSCLDRTTAQTKSGFL
jgi:hypothetical protein